MEGIAHVKYVLVNNPIVGQNIYVPRPNIYSTIELSSIVEYASRAAGIEQSAMIQTLDALKDAFSYYLCNGHSFKIDGVGTFSLSMDTKAADAYDFDPVTGADAVNGLGVNFLPAKEIKDMLAKISIETTPENPNNLAEFTGIIASRIALGSKSVSLLGHKDSDALFGSAGATVELGGFNLKDGLSVVIAGLNGEDEVSDAITLGGVRRSCNIAFGRLTKSFSKVTSVTVMDGDVVIGSWQFNGEGTAGLVDVYLGSQPVLNGSVFTVGASPLTIRGNVEGLVVTLDGETLTPASATSTMLTFNKAIGVGTHTLTVGETTITFKVSAEAVANVSTLSANGVTVNNGGSSPVRNGQTYNMVANGTNLAGITAKDISVPSGMSVANIQASADRVTFVLSVSASALAGKMSIANYECTLTITAPEVRPNLTKTPVADGGSYECNIESDFAFEGTNLSNVVCTANGENVTLQNKSANGFTLVFDDSGDFTYRFYADSSKSECIYSFTANVQLGFM